MNLSHFIIRLELISRLVVSDCSVVLFPLDLIRFMNWSCVKTMALIHKENDTGLMFEKFRIISV